MISEVQFRSNRSWRESILKTTNSRRMYQQISHEMQGDVGKRVQELIAENVKYIKTVPEEWAEYIVRYAYEQTQKGRRPEEIEQELRKDMVGKMTRNLKCIARTECAKANAAITQARAEMCGIRAYFWRSVSDERTRDSHAKMNGILVFYDDPPSPEALFGEKSYGKYHAGNTFNCRCYQEPVVDIMFLPDVVRVHDHGKILTMNRAELIRKYDLAA